MSADEGNLLRSLRRELGAPNRPSNPGGNGYEQSPGVGRVGGGGGGIGGGSTSRRSVGGGGINDLSSSRRNDLENGRLSVFDGSGAMEDDAYAGQEYSFTMFDPVWGQPDYPPGHHTTRCQFCGILCCPCLMGRDGWRGARNRNVWKRIRGRAAIITCWVDIAVFVLSIIVNGGFQPMWGKGIVNPLLGPSPQTLVMLGAKHLGLIQQGQIWRILTPILLHGGVLHMMLNLVSQFRLGTFLEERWGTRKWLLIYWLGGLAGNILSCAVSPDKVGVGASGSIYAIMGGWLAHITCTWNEPDEFDKCIQMSQAVLFTMFGMLMSVVPIVDWAAHFGGLVAGFMIGWWLFHTGSDDSRHMLRESFLKKAVRLQGTICMGILVMMMVLLLWWSLFVAECHIFTPGRPRHPHESIAK